MSSNIEGQGINQADFKRLFDCHYPAVCRRLTCLLGNRTAAEDVAQEVFLKLYQNPPREPSNLGGWLNRVATNLALNHLRSEKSRKHREKTAGHLTGTADAEPGPEESLAQAEEINLVRKVLQRLPERDRICLILKFSGMDYAQIANITGIKHSSVGKMLARARAKFKTEYKRLKGSDDGVL